MWKRERRFSGKISGNWIVSNFFLFNHFLPSLFIFFLTKTFFKYLNKSYGIFFHRTLDGTKLISFLCFCNKSRQLSLLFLINISHFKLGKSS